MKDKNGIWYIPDQEGKPTGPFTELQIEQWLGDKRCTKDMYCWCEGMAAWQPMAETEPFSEILADRATQVKRRFILAGVIAILILCLAGGGVAAYRILLGPAEVRQAKKLMASHLYKEAQGILEPFVERKPTDNQARYLLAMAQINQFVSGKAGYAFTITSLQGARANLSQVLTAEPLWIEKAQGDMAGIASKVPAGNVDRLERILEIGRLRADLHLTDTKVLAAELMGLVTSSCPVNGRDMSHHEGVIFQILEWDPSLDEQMAKFLVESCSQGGQELVRTLSSLEQWSNRHPVFAKPIAAQLLMLADTRYLAGRAEEAKSILAKALKIDSDCASDQLHILLCLRLSVPDDVKLQQSQSFLNQWPQSTSHSDVLQITVKDAVTVFDRHGRWNQNKAVPYLTAGYESAKELIRTSENVPDLDTDVFELSKRLAKNQQYDEAVMLMTDLLEAAPDSVVKLQAVNSIAEWRQASGKGNLAAEFDTLADQVDRDLNVMDLTMPAVIRVLVESPHSAHVVRVEDSCTINKFSNEEVKILKAWVANGGILWANNDVLSLFGIKCTYNWRRDRTLESWTAVEAEVCPVLTGVSRAVVSKARSAATDISGPRVIPLLVAGNANEKFAYWSLVPYGRGWISDAKTVDTSKFDGARFWLNFRLFCLGRTIPGAPVAFSQERLAIAPEGMPDINRPVQPSFDSQSSDVGSGLPSRITEADTLKRILAKDQVPSILWVALSRSDLDAHSQDRLREWVQQGGVLWVETNLAWVFGFKGITIGRLSPRSGQGQVPNLANPLLKGCAGARVSFQADENGVAGSGTEAEIVKAGIIPTLLVPSKIRGKVRFASAGCACGQGAVFLRPRVLQGPHGAGATSLESQLLKFSQDPGSIQWIVGSQRSPGRRG